MLLERLDQLDLVEPVVEAFRQDQGRLRREIPDPCAALVSRCSVDLHDLPQLVVVARLVVRRLVHLRDLEARLHGHLDRPGELAT